METNTIPMVLSPQGDENINSEGPSDYLASHAPVQSGTTHVHASLASANTLDAPTGSLSISPALSALTTSAPTPSTTTTTPSIQQACSSAPVAVSQQQPAVNSNPPSPLEPAHHADPYHRGRAATVSYWLKPLIAIVIYALTLGIAFSASRRYTLLGRVSASLGIWFLAVLAKAGDLYFAFAVADAFDCVAWGKLKKAQHNPSGRSLGARLEGFFALASSTGVVGLILIVWRNIKVAWTGEKIHSAIQSTKLTRLREMWKHWRPARWSVTRLICLIALIPGPGIILLAAIDQKEVFFDTRSITVSGGLAFYNPDLATVFKTALGPDISRLAQMMLRDPSLSWEVSPIDKDCKASKTCKSYLLADPYRTVSPWPFTLEGDDIDAFRLHNAPFYQVDLWNVDSEKDLAFDKTKECSLYVGFDPVNEFSTSLCMKQHSQDVVVAGWKTCQAGYVNSTNECLEPYSPPAGKSGWTTYFHFYRRNATVVFSRSRFTILEVKALSRRQSQNVSAASLFKATNAMLYRPNYVSNDFRYDRKSQPYILTQTIGYNLWQLTQDRMSGNPIGKDWLRNVLVLPVYLFQATVVATGENLPVFYQEDGATPLLNLPVENYVRGSYCIVDKRAIPSTETVIGYACVAGSLLAFVVLAK
ncbi:hypothetical protein EK21DRAFT_111627 [Setomelanomma holmii]|uniref:Transmembrane protein n=1 Tax=Setomelanomma holmii TaxID=210430 RepID=A0A9P4HBW3_9PLEO|nr:hypothetical protein EK21DRAFT_111627 [Setomelanomma holmii]